ncbi:hypothetical protein BX285_0319 [Streptomyces sp. 1114.5]|uniref:hypothetical protein n=1 Tax=Streptomyces sp. 1114.5 TaxID=1938830 RepID=UPI000EACF01D|nr:hypothetical protein [Streptomyces sp. 1114.5]RKT15995.1 hypothetical protein BX285_0319 [Streptomyces sp. 1114.5]
METNPAPEAVRELREIAHSWVDGRRTAPELLIEAALRALTAGGYSPSLLHLAALSSLEHEQAPELFDRVMEELGFGFHPPEDYWEGRLALARWWATEIVGGWLDPFEGASLILYEVAEPYGRCEELSPLIDAMLGPAEHSGSPHRITADLTQVAQELLARIPPPAGPVTRTGEQRCSAGPERASSRQPPRSAHGS